MKVLKNHLIFITKALRNSTHSVITKLAWQNKMIEATMNVHRLAFV